MNQPRTIIEIDEEKCDGCGLCVPGCHEGALVIVNGKARLRSEALCDGLGACIGECPRGAIREVVSGGCPGSRVISREVAAVPAGPQENPGGAPPAIPALRHWPVKIRLVPPQAPFLRGADLVVSADCVAVAHPGFHSEFVAGKAVLIGCPKLDDPEEYCRRLTQVLLGASVRSIRVVVMEVPCCQSLAGAVARAHDAAGCRTEVELVVVGVDGTVRTSRIMRPAS